MQKKNTKSESLMAVRERERERERELHFNEIIGKIVLNSVVVKVRKLVEVLKSLKNINTLIVIARLNL